MAVPSLPDRDVVAGKSPIRRNDHALPDIDSPFPVPCILTVGSPPSRTQAGFCRGVPVN